MAAQHLPRDLVWPSSGLKELAQTMMMMKQLVLAYCRHSLLNQPRCAVVCVLNKLIIKLKFFSSTAFPSQFLPGENFLPGIKNSSLSEPSGSCLRTTALAFWLQ